MTQELTDLEETENQLLDDKSHYQDSSWVDSFLKSVEIVVLLACVGFMVWQVRPDLVFSDSTLTGGDYGGHFEVPWFFSHYMLRHFQIRGFSPDWYDGYPFLVFYFPLPAVIVGLLGLVINYSVAFKLIIAASLVMLPISAYYFGKLTNLTRPIPAFLAVGVISYLYNYSYTIDGGNIFSTMAGEYSFEIALDLGLLYLGLCYAGLKSGKYLKSCVILLMLVIGCHVVVGLYIIGATVLIYVLSIRRNLKVNIKNFLRLFTIGLLGVGLLGFWWVPFYGFKGYMSNMGYYKITQYMLNLFPGSIQWAIYSAFAGCVVAFILTKRYFTAALACFFTGVAMSVAVFLGYSNIVEMIPLFAVFIFSWLLVTFQFQWVLFSVVAGVSGLLFVLGPNESLVYNGRYLPFWFLAIFFIASIGLGNCCILAESLIKRLVKSLKAKNLLTAVTGVGFRYGYMGLTLVITAASVVNFPWIFSNLSKKVGSNPAEGWIVYNFSGYQAKPDYKEFMALMSAMNYVGKKYGCGRAFWEYASNLDGLGTTMALMLLPYYTHECIDSEEGLFFESSATTPFHFLNQAELSAHPDYAMSSLPYGMANVFLGVNHLQLLGVRYFMTFSPSIQQMASIDPNLKLIYSTGPWYLDRELVTWKIYLVKHSSYVSALRYEPNVLTKLEKPSAYNLTPWTTSMLSWYSNPSDFPIELVASGLNGWPHIEKPTEEKKVSIAQNKITDIKVSTESISFNSEKTGLPVLVKVSYFPNWHATGALGPYRASPNLMVVVPTSHHVVIYWGPTLYDDIGKVISGFALIGLILLFLKKPKKIYSYLT